MTRTWLNKLLCHLYYVLLGVAGLGLLPPLLKRFEEAYGLSHARMALALGFASIVFALGGLAGGRWYDWTGVRAPLLASTAGTVAGVLALYSRRRLAPFVLALILFHFVHGLGVIVNPYVKHIYGERQAGGLNLLHGFQGVGRALAPLLVAACIAAGGGWRSSMLVSAALFAVFSAAVFLWLPPGHAQAREREDAAGAAARPMLRDPAILLGLLGFFFLSGGEAGIIIWTPNFLESEAGFSKDVALLTLSCMMAGYTAIRFALLFIPRVPPPRWLLASACALLAAAVLLLFARSAAVAYGLGFVVGAAFGGFYPTHAAALYSLARSGYGTLTGAFNLTSTAGGMFFLVLSGWVSDLAGLRYGVLLSVLSSCLFAVTYALMCRHPASAPTGS